MEGTCKGMLFGPEHFWLYESFNGDPVILYKAKWTDPGSEKFFQSFFCDPEDPLVVSALRNCLRTGNLRIDPDAFLGHGAQGYVFRVQALAQSASASSASAPPNPIDAEIPLPCALKVVPTTFGTDDIKAQYNLLLEAAKAGAPVAEVVPEMFFSTDEGCGYVMKSIAEKRLYHTNEDDVIAAFQALGELHAHNYVHGDARLPNVLYFNGKALWIDLQPPPEDLSVRDTFLRLARKDIKKLIRSAINDRDFKPSKITLAAYDGTVASAISIWNTIIVSSLI
jgi:hypothetical protein